MATTSATMASSNWEPGVHGRAAVGPLPISIGRPSTNTFSSLAPKAVQVSLWVRGGDDDGGAVAGLVQFGKVDRPVVVFEGGGGKRVLAHQPVQFVLQCAHSASPLLSKIEGAEAAHLGHQFAQGTGEFCPRWADWRGFWPALHQPAEGAFAVGVAHGLEVGVQAWVVVFEIAARANTQWRPQSWRTNGGRFPGRPNLRWLCAHGQWCFAFEVVALQKLRHRRLRRALVIDKVAQAAPSKKAMPQPSACSSVCPPRWQKPVKLKVASVGWRNSNREAGTWRWAGQWLGGTDAGRGMRAGRSGVGGGSGAGAVGCGRLVWRCRFSPPCAPVSGPAAAGVACIVSKMSSVGAPGCPGPACAVFNQMGFGRDGATASQAATITSQCMGSLSSQCSKVVMCRPVSARDGGCAAGADETRFCAAVGTCASRSGLKLTWAHQQGIGGGWPLMRASSIALVGLAAQGAAAGVNVLCGGCGGVGVRHGLTVANLGAAAVATPHPSTLCANREYIIPRIGAMACASAHSTQAAGRPPVWHFHAHEPASHAHRVP